MIKSVELKLYTIFGALATIAFCSMMIVFGYQHLYTSWGPNKGSLDPIHAGGIIFFSIIIVFTLVFTFFRLTEKEDEKEKKKPEKETKQDSSMWETFKLYND